MEIKQTAEPLRRPSVTRSFWRTFLSTCLLACGQTASADPTTCYLFSYFTTQNGGLRLAYSEDGYSFHPLNNGASYLLPALSGDNLMRDPSIVLGPDNVFHLVWTTSWASKTIGHASSTDLLNWSTQQELSLWSGHPKEGLVEFTWAPEITYDAANSRYLIVWASDLTGTYSDGLGDDYNPRQYASTTTNFTNFEGPRLFFNPGYDVIDATLLQQNGTHYMVFKDETQFNVNHKYLQLAESQAVDGAMDAVYGNITPAGTGFTPSGRWCEGATAARVNGDWIVYYDAYTSGYYGASRSSDLVNWTDITSQVSLPAGARHGTIIEVPVAVVKNLTPTPDTPTSLQAAANHTDVQLSWAAATNAMSYKIMQATQPGGPYVIVATDVTDTSHAVAAPVGVTRWYVVKATNGLNESTISNEVAAQALAPEMRVYLPFDETSGTSAADASGNGKDSQLINGPLWGTGRFGNAVDLDGSNDHVSLPFGIVDDLTSFTVCGWTKPDTDIQWGRLFDFGNGTTYHMLLTQRSGGGTARFVITETSYNNEQRVNGPSPLPTGTWSHFAVTKTGNTGILYINGGEVARNESMTLSPPDLGGTTQNWIGRSQYAADPYFNGKMDDFRIYAGALSAAEVTALANPSNVPPAAPQNLNLSSGVDDVTLSWNAVSGSTGYTVWRATSPDGPFTVIANGLTDTNFTDADPVGSGTSYYRVAALNGRVEGGSSKQVSVEFSTAVGTDDVFLFVYFTGNGEKVYAAYSENGRNYSALNGGSPVFTPPAWPSENLARDPSVLFENGTFHLVWTSDWEGASLGYASSPDLLNWSAPTQIMPFPGEQPRNVWAPEFYHDRVADNYKIVFSSSLPSELNDGDGSQDPAAPTWDQRPYAITTTDFTSFSNASLFLDQNFSLIDGQLTYDDRYTDDTDDDRVLMTAAVAGGGNPTVGTQGIRLTWGNRNIDSIIPLAWDDFRNHKSIVSGWEGQCLIRHGGEWLLYMDSIGSGYRLYTSADLLHWSDDTPNLSMPIANPRHGTFIRIPRMALGNLIPQGYARTWTGGGTANWSSPANWQESAAPSGPTALVFDGTTQTTATNDLAAGLLATDIQFPATAGNFTQSGSKIRLNGDLENLSLNVQTLVMPIELLGDSGTIAASEGDIILSGSLTGAGNILKTGAGTLRLTGTNSNRGVVFLEQGWTEFASNGLGNSSLLDFKGGALRWLSGNTDDISLRAVRFSSDAVMDIGSNNVTLNYPVGSGGDGGLIKQGNGTLTLKAVADYLGDTVVESGVVKPGRPVLAHRWSFNGTLTDSVGGSHALIVDAGANNATLSGSAVTLTGGAKASSDYISLGTNLLPDQETPVTIELWATHLGLKNWGRIFDFGSSSNENLFMSWSRGTNPNQDRVAWKNDSGTESGVSDTNAPYSYSIEYHIVLVVEPGHGASGNSRVTWYSAPRASGNLGTAKGSFETSYRLSNLGDVNNWLGRSQWPDDTANASYNEVRIWKSSLSAAQLNELHGLGPDANLTNIPPLANFLPSTSGLTLGPGAELDLNGAVQTVDSLTGESGSSIRLGEGTLQVGSGDTSATFAGAISGSGTIQVDGVLRLVGDATLPPGVTLINNGLLDIMTWNGTLPAGFVNNGQVLDKGDVKVIGIDISNGDVEVTVMGYQGHTYQFEWTDDLLAGPWQVASTAMSGADAPITFLHPGGAGATMRFYRVKVHP
jgi:autotransporter-associated beta strand protein